jgi:hypothetical protein
LFIETENSKAKQVHWRRGRYKERMQEGECDGNIIY